MKKVVVYREWNYEMDPRERIDQQIMNILVNDFIVNPGWRVDIRMMEKWEMDRGYNGSWFEVMIFPPRAKKERVVIRFWADAFRLLVNEEYRFEIGSEWCKEKYGDIVYERAEKYKECARLTIDCFAG